MTRGQEYLHGSEKRCLDVVGALFLGGVALPACVASSAAMAHELGLPMRKTILRQWRYGQNGKGFKVFKLRTLPLATELVRVTHGTYDPRAGKIGQLLRTTGIDEAPQVINVLRGDMSLVGPRPYLREDLDKLDEADPVLFKEWQETGMKAGITGPSQLMRRGRQEITVEDMTRSMRLDMEYAENASLATDVQALLVDTPSAIVGAVYRAIERSLEN